MANTLKRFYTGQPSSTAIDTLYTVPSDTKSLIKDILACNTSTGTRYLSLHAVPATSTGGLGTAGSSNAIFYNTPIDANDTISLSVSLALDSSNDTIQASQSTSADITLFISGLEVT